MPNDRNRLSPSTRRALDNACKKAGGKVTQALPKGAGRTKAARFFNKQLCKDVDQKALSALAEALVKAGGAKKTGGSSTPVERIKAIPKLSEPGKGVPSLTIPVPWSIPLDGITGNKAGKGKLKIKVWGDPEKLGSSKKGAMVFVTVKF